MATGFEIVGLALAIFPILVEGIKFYMGKKGWLRDFIHYRHVLRRIFRDLSREQISFRNSSQRFLEGIAGDYGLGSSDIHEMMRDPQDARWRKENPFQEDDLQYRSVAAYLDTVEDIKEVLEEIQAAVGIHGNTQPALLDKSTLRRQWSKITLVLSEDEIEKHLERARKLNTFLYQLIEQNKPTAPGGRVSQRSTLHYKKIQGHAIELYEIFQAKLSTAPTCNCILGHTVNMKLEFRSARTTASGLYFHTIFTLDHVESTFTPLCNWREIEMEPLGATQYCRDTDVLHTAVRFVEDSPATQMASLTVSEISNLCTIIKGPTQPGIWLGYLANSQGCRHRIRVLALDQLPVASQTIQTVSLPTVLNRKEFRLEHKCRLGLKLASSVMQLHATQWLADYWSKKDISFARFSDGKVDFNNPLIEHNFGIENDMSGPIGVVSRSGFSGSIPCLFSLGIVLLELVERRTFEEMKSVQNDFPDTEEGDAKLAMQLACLADCGPNYRKVMKRCIGGLDAAFGIPEDDIFKNEILRDEVERKIILPLEEDLKWYCEKTYIEDCI